MSEDISKWGSKNLCQWALITLAPLSASGLNEIWATTVSKNDALALAGSMGIRVTEKGLYRVVRLEELRKKES